MSLRYIQPVLAALFVTVIFLSPVIEDFSFWGQMDWDQFVSWNAIPRDTLLRYGQFPLWNPYVNGGNVLLAHPHSPFLSPFYVFVLVFGAYPGLKIQIFVYFFLGLVGMYSLARFYDLGFRAACFSSIVYMLSAVFALHLTEGHTEWLVMSFVPWLFYFYQKSLHRLKDLYYAIIVLCLILLNGSVDVFSITLAFLFIYSFLKSFQLSTLRPLKNMITIAGATACLCAVKLLPMLEFLRQFPRHIYDNTGTPWAIVAKIFLYRGHIEYDLFFQEQIQETLGIHYLWHEYGAYMGLIPLGLALLGMIKMFKTKWPLVLSGIIFLFIAMGRHAPVNCWQILHCFPFWDSQKVPSRYILGFLFVGSIMAGFAFHSLERWMMNLAKNKNRLLNYVPTIILLIVFTDLYLVNHPIFENAFSVKPLVVSREDSFVQRFRKEILFRDWKSRSSIYPIFLSNSGILDAYEVVQIEKKGVRALWEEGYRGEAFLLGGAGQADVVSFSPNTVRIKTSAENPDKLVMNQNYYTGWNVRKNGRSYPAEPYDGMVSTPIPAGASDIEFYYLPQSFLIGLTVSLVSIVFISSCYIVKGKRL
jgi:hypothetical protein